MTSITATHLTIAQLDLSTFNVRTNRADATRTAALEASIAEHGLIQPLSVHPMLGARGRFGVFAGGRRYRSIRNLIERGALPADWAIQCNLYEGYSEAELIELSMAENLPRCALRDYEVFAGVARAHLKGHPPEVIAESLGQDELWVRQAIRLGDLAKPIFDALEAGRIGIDEARAYGATADQALQVATFEELQPLPEWQRTAEKIRAHLRVGDLSAARTLRFVGADAYLAAGGGFERDLFADGVDRGRVVDEPLLQRLLHEKLADLRAATRAAAGRPDLRFAPAPPTNEWGTDWTLEITARGEDDAPVLPEGAILATIDINDAGEPRVSFWWESRKAKFGTTRPPPTLFEKLRRHVGSAIDDRASPGATQEANAAIREEEGIGADTIQIARSMRRAAMRAAFVEDAREGGEVGRDWLIWSQLRLLLARAGNEIGASQLTGASPDPAIAQPFIDSLPGRQPISAAIGELVRQSFLAGEDLGEAFLDFCESSQALKTLAAAVVAGLSLERSLNADGYALPTHDALAVVLQLDHPLDLRRHLPPSLDFVARIPKRQRFALAEPFVERAAFGAWSRLKDAEVTERVCDVLAGRPIDGARAATAHEALEWVHPLLRFGRADAAPAYQEAAE